MSPVTGRPCRCPPSRTRFSRRPPHGGFIGVDVFVESARTAESLGKSLERLTAHAPLRLAMVSNRGTKVYPASGAMTDPVDLTVGVFEEGSPCGNTGWAWLLRISAAAGNG
jgi:hypothetical protein